MLTSVMFRKTGVMGKIFYDVQDVVNLNKHLPIIFVLFI